MTTKPKVSDRLALLTAISTDETDAPSATIHQGDAVRGTSAFMPVRPLPVRPLPHELLL